MLKPRMRYNYFRMLITVEELIELAEFNPFCLAELILKLSNKFESFIAADLVVNMYYPEGIEEIIEVDFASSLVIVFVINISNLVIA